MYFAFGGCSTLFHLLVKHPLLVAVFGIASVVQMAHSAPAPGAWPGTDGLFASVEHQLVKEHPELPAKLVELEHQFAATSSSKLDWSEASRILGYTDPCTDLRSEDVFDDSHRERDVAWLSFLDRYGRGGPPIPTPPKQSLSINIPLGLSEPRHRAAAWPYEP